MSLDGIIFLSSKQVKLINEKYGLKTQNVWNIMKMAMLILCNCLGVIESVLTRRQGK